MRREAYWQPAKEIRFIHSVTSCIIGQWKLFCGELKIQGKVREFFLSWWVATLLIEKLVGIFDMRSYKTAKLSWSIGVQDKTLIGDTPG